MAYFPPTGSVVAFQADPTKLQAHASVSGRVGASIIGTVPVTGFPANQSVSGAVNVDNFPTNQNVSGSVVSYQGTDPWIIKGSVQGTFETGNSSVQVLNFPTNQNVSGSVVAFQGGIQITSISGIPQASVHGEVTVASTVAIGNTPVVNQGTNPWIITGSVQTTVNTGNSSVQVLNFPTNQNVSGSVVAFQGAGWSGSVAAQITGGVSSVALAGANTVSVVGTVSINPASVSGTVGASVIGTVPVVQSGTQITSVSGVAFVPDANAFYYVGSIVSGSVTLIAGSVAGKRHYVTDFAFANTGSVSTLVTFQDGSTSILGHTLVPDVGGSNFPGAKVPIRAAVGQDLAFKSSASPSVLYATISGITI